MSISVATTCKLAAWAGILLLATPVFAAAEYTDDGDHGARNEAIRWLINRARHAPEREADRYGLVNAANRDFDVCEDADGVNDFGTTAAQWAVWAARKPPLAPHRLVSEACDTHCRDMAETQVVQHNSPSANYYPLNSAPMQRQTVEGVRQQCVGLHREHRLRRQRQHGRVSRRGGHAGACARPACGRFGNRHPRPPQDDPQRQRPRNRTRLLPAPPSPEHRRHQLSCHPRLLYPGRRPSLRVVVFHRHHVLRRQRQRNLRRGRGARGASRSACRSTGS
jgi:hypothetical protein